MRPKWSARGSSFNGWKHDLELCIHLSPFSGSFFFFIIIFIIIILPERVANDAVHLTTRHTTHSGQSGCNISPRNLPKKKLSFLVISMSRTGNVPQSPLKMNHQPEQGEKMNHSNPGSWLMKRRRCQLVGISSKKTERKRENRLHQVGRRRLIMAALQRMELVSIFLSFSTRAQPNESLV